MIKYILSRLRFSLLVLLLLALAFSSGYCEDNNSSVKAVINLSNLTITVTKTNQVFAIGIGKKVGRRTLTPTGTYKVIAKARRNGKDAFGTRVLVLDCHIHNKKHVCMHGTNEPELIKLGYISHGCIRMNNKDAEQLYDLVNIGDYVEIKE